MKVVLSLGTNSGDRFANMSRLEMYVNLMLNGTMRKSPLYETAPVGVENHPDYLNRVVVGEYEGTPETLLDETQEIETHLGRTEKGNLAPRTADIDILLFGDQIVETEKLKIPHHALFERRYSIEGTQSIAPEMIVPGTDKLFGNVTVDPTVLLQELRTCAE